MSRCLLLSASVSYFSEGRLEALFSVGFSCPHWDKATAWLVLEQGEQWKKATLGCSSDVALLPWLDIALFRRGHKLNSRCDHCDVFCYLFSCTDDPFSRSYSPFLRSVSQVKGQRLRRLLAWWTLVPAVKFWNKASDQLKIPLLPGSPPHGAVAANSHLWMKQKDPDHSRVINLPFLMCICLSVFRFTCHLVLVRVWIGVLVRLGKGNFAQMC